jgi:RNA polymerase primary sigma factor
MNHDKEHLRNYLRQIRKYPEISRERELELAERIQTNDDEDAVRELVEANLRYVTLIARKYIKSGIPLSDLISEGNIGLMAAARRFEPDRGVKFITYAVWWIRQAILFAISSKSRMIRLPPKQEYLLQNIRKTRIRLLQELGREPTFQEIASELDTPVSEIENLIQLGLNSVSLDPVMGDNDDREMGMDIPDKRPIMDDLVIKDEFVDDVELLLTCLPEREKEILKMHFGFDGDTYTLQQIGDRFNLTRERIRQIERRAIEKLRQKAITRNLKDYLSE